jgi:methylmalonyl-CoA/ethylmalonyl-CoA epimerase
MDDNSPQLQISGIGQISVTVHDLQRAIAFYRDVLEIRFHFEIPNAAFFDCGGIRLMLAVPEAPEFDHPSSILYYRVGEIQQAYELLRSREVPFEHEPQLIARLEGFDLWLAFFRDPENNLLALMSEVPRM